MYSTISIINFIPINILRTCEGSCEWLYLHPIDRQNIAKMLHRRTSITQSEILHHHSQGSASWPLSLSSEPRYKAHLSSDHKFTKRSHRMTKIDGRWKSIGHAARSAITRWLEAFAIDTPLERTVHPLKRRCSRHGEPLSAIERPRDTGCLESLSTRSAH